MTPASCGNCLYFRADGDLPMGECRVHSPSIDMMPIYQHDIETDSVEDEDGEGIGLMTMHTIEQVDVTRRGVWPQVAIDDWCGEFEASE